MGLFEQIIENKIKEAIKNKEFENIKGFGKPIDNSEYFSVPKEHRITHHILKNSGAIPEVLQIKKDIASINKKISSIMDPVAKKRLSKEKDYLQTKYNLFNEKRKLQRL